MKYYQSKIRSSIVIYLFVNVFISETIALRIDSLKELNKDSSSITIEWSINEEHTVPVATSSEATDSSGGAIQTSESEWIGFKIKYFTDKLQYTPILLKNSQLRRFRLDNLKSNTLYTIQVSAFNVNESEGPASNLLNVKTHEAGKNPI
jgi:hypothetical protein